MKWIVNRLGLILAAIAAGVFAVLRHLSVLKQRDRAERELKRANSQIDESNEFAEIEAEINAEYSALEREAKDAIKQGAMPDHLRDRNR